MNFGHYIAFCKPYSEEELDAVALTNTDGKLFSHCYVLCGMRTNKRLPRWLTTSFQALFRAILAASSTGRAAPREARSHNKILRGLRALLESSSLFFSIKCAVIKFNN
jgi:hypothetical protein